MLTGLVVFHSKTASQGPLLVSDGYFHFLTCMRSIVIGFDPNGQHPGFAEHHKFEGQNAYKFLLEIICGLHSPLLGETEVLGQFREFAKSHQDKMGSGLKDIIASLLVDAKKVRAQHLQNIGSHSYGSLIRKHLSEKPTTIHFLGAGHLVEEILPWLKKLPHTIKLYTRNIDKHAKLMEQYPQLQMQSLEYFANDSADVIVIAAPIEAAQIQQWLLIKKAATVFDLRSDSHIDLVKAPVCYTLQQLFADINTNRQKVIDIKNEALAKVSSLAREKYLQEKPRPFGWEDLWAM